MNVTRLMRRVSKTMRASSAYTAAVLVAAGSAARMGGIDKVMAPLGGEPLLCHGLRALEQAPSVQEIVVVTRQDLLEAVSTLCAQKGFSKVTLVVCGGKTRTESVRIGLANVSKQAKTVAIHDAARPFVSQSVIAAAIHLAGKTGAAAPALPVKDTIKVQRDHVVAATPNRASLAAVQTPQCFDRELICAALEQAVRDKVTLTDDCSAMEHIGFPVHLCAGEELNFKVTTPQDLELAQLLLSKGEGICE